MPGLSSADSENMHPKLEQLLKVMLTVMLATAFLSPRALASLSLCRCSGSHGEPAALSELSENVCAPVVQTCCAKHDSSPAQSTPEPPEQERPDHAPGPCDCPAYCCAGKLLLLAPVLPPTQLVLPLERPLNVRSSTVLSLNYHAEILRPPRV